MIDDYFCQIHTALDMAAWKGNAELVELLLGAGADPYVGFHSKYHLMCASQFDHITESIRLLEVSGNRSFCLKRDISMWKHVHLVA